MDITIPKGSYETKIMDIEILNPSETDQYGFKMFFQIQKGKYKGVYFETQCVVDSEKEFSELTEEDLTAYTKLKFLAKDLKLGLKMRETLYETAETWEKPYIQQNLQQLEGKTLDVFIAQEVSHSDILIYNSDFVIKKQEIPWSCLLWTFVIAVIAILIFGSNS